MFIYFKLLAILLELSLLIYVIISDVVPCVHMHAQKGKTDQVWVKYRV